MSSPSVFFHAVVSPVSCVYGGLGQLCRVAYLDRVAETAFRFFRSYGNSPKDLAKAVQTLASWAVAICDKRGSPNTEAQKVSDFAKQVKCFISLASLPAQLTQTVGICPEAPEAVEQPRPARGIREIIGECTGLYSSVFDSVSLLSCFGVMSSKTRAFETLKLGNNVSTILGSVQRLKGDALEIHGHGVRSRRGRENAVKLIGNLAVLALGFLPLLSGFKACSSLASPNIMLRISTIAVISNLLDKHIPRSLPRR